MSRFVGSLTDIEKSDFLSSKFRRLVCAALLLYLSALFFSYVRNGWDSEQEAQVYCDKGRQHLDAGNFKAALPSLEKAVAIRPSFAEAQFLLGLACLEEGLYDRALSGFLAAASSKGVGGERILQSANGFVAREQFRMAEQLINCLLAKEPLHLEGLFTKAELALQREDAAAAEQALASLSATGQQTSRFYQLEARLHLLSGRQSQAESAYRSAIALDPSRLESYDALAALLLSMGNLEKAGQVIDAMMQLFPGDPRSYLARGAWHLAQGRPEQARESFLLAVETSPRSYETFLALAEFCAAQHRNDEAEEAYRKAQKYAPETSAAQMKIGRSFMKTGRWQQADQVVNTILAKDPQNEAASAAEQVLASLSANGQQTNRFHQLAARLHLLNGRQSQVERAYRSAIAFYPSRLEYYDALAALLLSMGNLQKAGHVADAMTQLFPGDPRSYLAQGAWHQAQGRPELARESFLQAVETSPESYEAYLSLAECCAAQHRNDEAEEAYRKAQGYAPETSESQMKIGRSFVKTRRWQQAAQVVTAVLAQDPQHDEASAMQAWLAGAQGQEDGGIGTGDEPAEEKRQLTGLIAGWSRSWSARDVDRYFEYYADTFVPEGAMALAEWKKARRQRLGKNFIRVTASQVSVTLASPVLARTSFIQNYESETHQDRTTKVLTWRKEGARWRIVKEEAAAGGRSGRP